MSNIVDIIVPVYNEGESILRLFKAFSSEVKTPLRFLICYDFDEDATLRAINENGSSGYEVVFVKNNVAGPHGAVMAGFRASNSDVLIVYPADDDYNAGIIDGMIEAGRNGNDIVCASRFMQGGTMEGCRFVKSLLVRTAAFTLYHFARAPTHDPTNGLRLFSRRLLDNVEIESREGFTYSLELLAKCHRMGWPIYEIPAKWFERDAGGSRFKVLQWIPPYLHWYFYIFATTWLRLNFKGINNTEKEIDT